MRPSELYPGGFAAVPLALLKRDGCKTRHVALFVALWTLARTNGNRPVAKDARERRLLERSGIGSIHTLRKTLEDLEEWGFIAIEKRQGFPSTFVLLPVDEDPTSALRAEEAEDLEHRPDIAGRRGGRPTIPQRATALGDVEKPSPAAETPSAKMTNPQRETALGGSAKSRPLHKTSIDIFSRRWCAEAHRLMSDETKVRNLAKAVGQGPALEGLTEIDFRLRHSDEYPQVEELYALARLIAKNPEEWPLLRGRREDVLLTERAEAAKGRDPTPVEEDDLERERERQRAALAAVENFVRESALPPGEDTPAAAAL